MSVASDDALKQALLTLRLGYHRAFLKTPGRGSHYTMTVIYDANNQLLTNLSAPIAQALANIFKQQANPHQIP